MSIRSRVGVGEVMHSRLSPKKHAFTYKVFQPLFDLDEMPSLLQRLKFWAYEKFNLASFKRKDHFGDPDVSLKECVARETERQLGISVDGRIEMLANLRYFGIGMNPICMFFCYDREDNLIACTAEVTNTPWGEKICYAMPVREADKLDDDTHEWTHSNAKQMHVSPFMPMDMEYRWKIFKSGERLSLQIENWKDEQRSFIATMNLKLREATASNLNRTLFRFPLMTLKVIFAIYWQAVRLKLKGLKVFDHPGHAPTPPAPINVSEK